MQTETLTPKELGEGEEYDGPGGYDSPPLYSGSLPGLDFLDMTLNQLM